jgi:hypothetical protein
MDKKLPIIFIIVLIIVGAAAYGLNRRTDSNSNAGPGSSQQSDNTTVTKTGTLGCLRPKDPSGPQTLECALGIAEDSGTMYALRADDPALLAGVATGQKIEVTGKVIQQTTKYDSAGTIELTSLRKL